MRVLATTQPGSSVFFQMAPLLTALSAAGNQVRVATSGRFAAVVNGVGLEHEAVGIDWLESAIGDTFPEIAQHRHDPHGAVVRFVVDVFVRRTAPQFATDAVALIDRWKPDLLLHSVNEFGGAAAAEASGVPHLMIMAGLDNWFDRFGPALRAVDECRRAVGLSPVEGDEGWLFSNGVLLAEVPGWSARSVADLSVSWLRPTSPSQSALDLEWLDQLPRPLVHVTLGTVFNKIAKPLFGLLASGAATVAKSVVVTVGADLEPNAFTGLAANVHVRRYLPLAHLLERCDAVLAHGGWGTLIACAEAGLPMGAVVLGADQGYNARIVEQGRWGLAIQPQDCSPASTTEWTKRLLTDTLLREGSRRVRAALGTMPSPADVAASLTARFR